MEVYKAETKEIINRFLARRLGVRDCIAALDAALAGLIPKLEAEQLPQLRAMMLANYEVVRKETLERESERKANAKARLKARLKAVKNMPPKLSPFLLLTGTHPYRIV